MNEDTEHFTWSTDPELQFLPDTWLDRMTLLPATEAEAQEREDSEGRHWRAKATALGRVHRMHCDAGVGTREDRDALAHAANDALAKAVQWERSRRDLA